MRLLLTSACIKNASIHKVVDGAVEVVSEGQWKFFTPSVEATEAV